MRKSIAFILLGLQLFNMGGYQLLFKHIEERSATHFIEQLNTNNYNESQLIEIKVPISLPYTTDWDSYERYDGEVIVDGIHYNYVKRKLANDSMSFLCIPNNEKMSIINSKNIYYSLVNDIQDQHEKGEFPSPISKLSKMFFSEYSTLTAFEIKNGLLNPETLKYFSTEVQILQRPFDVLERPPHHYFI